MSRLPVLPMPLVPTTIIRIGRCFVCRPSFANDDFGDVEFIVFLFFFSSGARYGLLQCECAALLCNFIHRITRSIPGIYTFWTKTQTEFIMRNERQIAWYALLLLPPTDGDDTDKTIRKTDD